MRLSIAAAIAVSIIPASAIANPVWLGRMTVTSAPGPHILIAYQYDATYGDSSVGVETFYGTGHSVPKVGPDTSADTGSGSRSLKTREVCDCYVPTGKTLRYVLLSVYASSEISLSPSHSGPVPGSVCYAECASAPSLDAAMPVDVETSAGTGGSPGTGGSVLTGTGGAPGTGGSTVLTGTGGAPGTGGSTVLTGTGGAPGTGGSTVSSGAAGAPGVGGATLAAGTGGAPGSSGTTNSTSGTGGSEGKKSGFCAIALPARPLALPVLGMLAGLALAVWRRRRA